MATDVIMPALGMAQETGTVLRWLKHEGEAVVRGELLLEIETDKATAELEAPATGVLTAVTAAEGDIVPVGTVIAKILEPGELPRPERAAPPRAGGRVPASPKARKRAAEQGIDLTTVGGSGPGGAVLASDLPGAQAGLAMSTAWRLMAERTAQSWTTAPHIFLMRDVRADRLADWRAACQRRFEVEITYTDLLVRLVAAALRRHPRLCARWEGGRLLPGEGVHIGIAVAIDDGLVVPVIRDADRLTLAEITRRRSDLVTRARDHRLRPDDLAGGTFTISNLGMYAVDAFCAIINPPQAAILGVGRIAERVVPVGGRPEIRLTMTLCLACDHRVVDGARGAQFLDTLGDLIEEPAGLLD
ncbi:MAG: dihydrolipoamide acetyltransferase family protein [Armatimonadota bacterium]|nr:dihydrolipoamide acetyltransferase family protein [Armatimonadota bacterium]